MTAEKLLCVCGLVLALTACGAGASAGDVSRVGSAAESGSAAMRPGASGSEDGASEGSPTGGTDSEGGLPARDAEADAAQALVEARSQIACDFIRTWCTTTGFDPNDDTVVLPIDDWYGQVVSFVAPGSVLYDEFERSEYPYGPASYDAVSVARDVWVSEVDGDTYTVVVSLAATQSAPPGWTEDTFELSHVVAFDEDNHIVRLDDWGA